MQYENIETPLPNEMTVGTVIGDAAPGALYSYSNYELWVSFDYGESWEYRETFGNAKYMSGQNNGMIFKRNGAELSISNDYGYNFEIITNPINCPIRELGYYLGEFYGINGDIGIDLYLDHTSDYASTYTETPIDSSVAFWSPSGQYPQITRGTEPGELYLTSRWPDYHYKIFHSTDTGYTWTQKYESDYIDISSWGVSYTSGREPGTFYVTRSTYSPDLSHAWLYVDYSSDYGETFTTYFHDLDLTAGISNVIKKGIVELTNSPNPLNASTTFLFKLPKDCENPKLNVYNSQGILIEQFNINGKQSLIWNGTDGAGSKVSDGLYLYNISCNKFNSQFNKLLVVH